MLWCGASMWKTCVAGWEPPQPATTCHTEVLWRVFAGQGTWRGLFGVLFWCGGLCGVWRVVADERIDCSQTCH